MTAHRVYMRDWYFNAGIAGFLSVLSGKDRTDVNEIQGLVIGDNFIEFDETVLEDFEKNFNREAFLKFFNKEAYLSRFRSISREIAEKKEKIKLPQIEKKLADIEASQYKNFLAHSGLLPAGFQDVEYAAKQIQEIIRQIENLTAEAFLEHLNSGPAGREAVLNFIKIRLKGVCGNDKLKKYIADIKKTDEKKAVKDKDICPSCQKRKATEEFSNSISNVIGFNKDNSNWAWGHKSTKIRICPVCALIYNCAFVSFAYLLKKSGKNWLNYFYFVNRNENLEQLYKDTRQFTLRANADREKGAFYLMIRETVRVIRETQAQKTDQNINFIEIVDQPILAGQGTKGYSVYNYSIDKDIAGFLHPFLSSDKMPGGYYEIKDTRYSVSDELLKLAIERQIGYPLLYRFYAMSIRDSFKTWYNLGRITNFVRDYISHVREKNMNREANEKLWKKAFKSGIEFKKELEEKHKKKNQINGLAYGFLNDLKIENRHGFLDKYIRAMMSAGQPIFFGEEELLDTEKFLLFGYSFLNGLLYQEKKEGGDDKNEEGANS